MKNLKIVIAAFLLTAFCSKSFCQQLAAENSIEISGKAKRGYLGNVVVNDAAQTLDMVFVTKSTNRKVKFEVYQFDYNLKLINNFKDEQEVDKARAKYPWFKFRGNDEETITAVTAEGTMMGALVFKKKEVTLKYNWLTGRYRKTEKILDKIKPKSEDDKSYLINIVGINEEGKPLYSAFDLDETGEVLAIVGEKGKMKEDPFKSQKEFLAMKANADLNITIASTISFENPQSMIFCGVISEGAINEDEAPMGEFGLVFAPVGGQGYGKVKQADPTQYTFVRLGRDGSLKERITFNTKASKWSIENICQKDGGIFIYGLAKALKDPEDAYRRAGDATMKIEKGSNLQIVGIRNGKTVFVSVPNLDDFEAKAAKPDNQKKPNVYRGGKLNIGGVDIVGSGDIFINAQEYSYDAVGSHRGNKYDDFLMFHFNSSGELVRCYGVDNAQKTGLKGLADPMQDPKYHPTQSVVFQGADKNSVYWMQYFISNVERRDWNDGMYKYTSWSPRTQVRIGKIDVNGAKIGNFSTLGDGAQGKKKFYLMNEFPSVKINNGKQLIFIGEDTNKWGMDSSGDYIWLGKFDPEKI